MEIIHKSRGQKSVRVEGHEKLDTQIFAAAFVRRGVALPLSAWIVADKIFDAIEGCRPNRAGLNSKHFSMKYLAIRPLQVIDTELGNRAIQLRKSGWLHSGTLVFILQYQRVFPRRADSEGAISLLFEGLELLIQDQQLK